jgi:hypothetical protein
MSSAQPRKPWPMKWIVLAILLCIIPYTYVTLHYRKTAPAFQPYEDIKNRANVMRLLNAGYRRIALPAEVPADALQDQSSAPIQNVAGGLPAELKSTLAEPPALPVDITRVIAPASARADHAYSFRLACTLPDERRTLAGAELYVKDSHLVVTPDFEKLSGGLMARTRDNVIQLTVPASTLKPGKYEVLVVGQKSSRGWTLEVR